MAHPDPVNEPPIPTPPTTPTEIDQIDTHLLFPAFTASTAWTLGTALRSKLLAYAKPCVIDISLAQACSSGEGGRDDVAHCLFHAVTHSGTTPDNERWVRRKRAAVLRWGVSSYSLGRKFEGDEAAFAAKFMLGESAGRYAIHGGGWPVRVRGVEGIVAVVVVSGLKQEQDHGIIVQTVGEMLEEMGVEMGVDKRKED